MRTDPVRPFTQILALTAGAALAVAIACTLPAGDFSGRTCSSQLDCPEPYACVVATRGAVKTCELLPLPKYLDGGAEPLDGGNVFYCTQVKPLLDKYCVSCHGPDLMQGGTFRLDWYDRDGGVPGAREYANRIKFRAYDTRTMPSPGAKSFPTDEERRDMAIWVVSGAPFCDAGTKIPDGGVDAGK